MWYVFAWLNLAKFWDKVNYTTYKITRQRLFYLIQYFPCLETMVTSKNCRTDKTIMRGRDWDEAYNKFNQDKNGTGVIYSCGTKKGHKALVRWSHGGQFRYRIEIDDGLFDLSYAGNNKSPNA